MKMYQVCIEAPGLNETETFEAATPEEAEEIGKQIFFDTCNYGISEVETDDD